MKCIFHRNDRSLYVFIDNINRLYVYIFFIYISSFICVAWGEEYESVRFVVGGSQVRI